ncbi:MAG: hypothetical protein KAU94_10000 [Verrucomicrobia bacterium]|nr:hypothetical protein [Verrucomicrobiota bacterium]
MSGKKQTKSGYDAPLISIKDDCFDHARTARSIHSLVMGTPSDWSVRVGIYSEWGSGKTTVCHFVDDLLDINDAVAIWFNPWQYRSKDELCFGFVTAIFSELKSLGYELPRSLKIKKSFAPLKKLASGAVASWNDLAGEGFNVLTSFVNLGLKEAEELRTCLGSKRVVIFIDDLDRTDPKLVPELLFALREIMDIPGFAFLCAFDPNVVGKVLGEYHSGFGDGLAFLDKIIDYPIWLPTPTQEQLMKMALRDIEKYAPFVPSDAFQNTISMLPQNPRSIRQFVRMLTMLSTQIDRHHAEELNWSLILGSNVVRVRFPRIASYLLAADFWDGVQKPSYAQNDDDEKPHEAIEKLVRQNTVLTNDKEIKVVADVICLLSDSAPQWMVLDEYRNYHFKIAEGPAAVTWKEFDEFVEAWNKDSTSDALNSWVAIHAQKIQRSNNDVSRELFEAAINKRQAFMNTCINAYESADAQANIEQTDLYLEIMNCMTSDLSGAEWFGSEQFEKVVKAFDQYVDFTNTEVYLTYREKERQFFYALLDRLPDEFMPYYKVLFEMVQHPFKRATSKFFDQALSILQERLSLQIISQFHKRNFIKNLMDRNDGCFHTKLILFDPKGPVWAKHREAALNELKTAEQRPELRSNAVDLFMWMDSEQMEGDSFPRKLTTDIDVIKAWFDALITEQLEPRIIGSMRKTFAYLDPEGTVFEYPGWWIEV